MLCYFMEKQWIRYFLLFYNRMLNYSYASNVTYLVMRMSDQSLWFLSFVLIENIRKRHKPNQLHLHIIFYCCFHELVGFTFSSKNNIWNVRKINIWSNTICFIIHWIYTFKPFLTLFFNSSKHFFPLAKFSRNWLATWQTSFFQFIFDTLLTSKKYKILLSILHNDTNNCYYSRYCFHSLET